MLCKLQPLSLVRKVADRAVSNCQAQDLPSDHKAITLLKFTRPSTIRSALHPENAVSHQWSLSITLGSLEDLHKSGVALNSYLPPGVSQKIS